MHRNQKLSRHEEERIYRWLVHGDAEAASASDRDHFNTWLEQTPARKAKARSVNNLWNHPEFHQAVTLMASSEAANPSRPKAWQRGSRLRGALSVAACVLAVVASTQLLLDNTQPAPASQVYRTAHGQTAHHTLSDGSQLDLSASARLAVEYGEHARQVRLYDGEARFSVAKDRQRPFTVESRHATMRALGTVFEVDQRSGMTELVVLEGTVAVHPLESPQRRVEVTAGHRVRIGDQRLAKVESFDLKEYRSWLDGQVQADKLPLAELLTELNRYAEKPIVARGGAARLPVSGSFALDKMESNIEILARLHRLQVEHTADAVVLREQ
ncbi:FecR domain-containing protein [Microbulbifer sp.]|uniref:FecR family protein n=1 Tax=Microbulbifer sp. TaxID=1908541 RepID=UPI0025829CC1|nr:FecR domain-containing protein [Microbulbifer sp.]